MTSSTPRLVSESSKPSTSSFSDVSGRPLKREFCSIAVVMKFTSSFDLSLAADSALALFAGSTARLPMIF